MINDLHNLETVSPDWSAQGHMINNLHNLETVNVTKQCCYIKLKICNKNGFGSI